MHAHTVTRNNFDRTSAFLKCEVSSCLDGSRLEVTTTLCTGIQNVSRRRDGQWRGQTSSSVRLHRQLADQERPRADRFVSGNHAPDSPCPHFQATLSDIVHEYSTNPPKSKFDEVIAKQDQVKDQVIDNIEAVVKRHKEIEITLYQTESLKETSIAFTNSSKQVRKTAQCKMYKQYAIFAAVVLVVIGVLVLIICLSAKC